MYSLFLISITLPLLLVLMFVHIINHVLIPKLGFDYTKDFTAVGLVTSGPMLIATNPSLPVSNLKELTQLLKSAPGKYSYATCNVASPHHFAMEIYKHTMKKIVPYLMSRLPCLVKTCGGPQLSVQRHQRLFGADIRRSDLYLYHRTRLKPQPRAHSLPFLHNTIPLDRIARIQ